MAIYIPITNVWRISSDGIKIMSTIRLYFELFASIACRTTELNLETLILNFMKAMNSVPR